MPAGRRGGVILVNPGISGVFLKTGPGTPLGVASFNLNLNFSCSAPFPFGLLPVRPPSRPIHMSLYSHRLVLHFIRVTQTCIDIYIQLT